MKGIPKRCALAALGTGAGWAGVLLSVALFALHWRASNEPGAGDFPTLLLSARLSCGLGCVTFLGGQVYLVAEKAWPLLAVSWGICLALAAAAVALAPILLLLMV